MTEITRKHFRFPAYDDHLGVKLKNENKRVLFDGQDDLLNDTKEQALFEEIQGFHFDDYSKNMDQSNATINARHSSAQQENLAKHKEKLPDYRSGKSQQPKRSGQSSLFGNGQRVNPANKRETKSSQGLLNTNGRERSYFVPKYVPASIIPDTKKKKISEEELLTALKKEKNAYLLFDTGDTPYQGKQEEANQEKSRTNKEVNHKNRGVLDRSLKGLIEDQGNTLNENGYFR
ncbi:hypothetical protein A5844_000319 [Enterococcus sp. 10A9_DIV0425]|uniref:Uncharacterized protein n=1 Tax=Candidatus Enterococcus wittei TaxID=1987383 RepID=A0A2C9XPI0_9ENTE|nr:hypothetical protein [Enterococcus sp. 10A9_DIV0425]OTP12103.1 hypothetical protein A5844_000319 [Enterococcus sp. 10A9_DIV0425]THE16079.1 hypothetical protein E1H99_00555 [Enterococcus hirae]